MEEKTASEIINKFGGYNDDSAHEIIKLRIAGCSKNRRDVNGELIHISGPSYIGENLDKFEGKLSTDIALVLLHHGQYQSVFFNINKFEDIREIIYWSVYLCPNAFWDMVETDNRLGIQNQELAEMLIDMKYGIQLIENMPRLGGLDYKKTFDLLLEYDPRALGQAICYGGMENFKGINGNMYDDTVILYKLLEKNNPIICRGIGENINKFYDLKKEDYNNIAIKLIKFGAGKYVVENICKFKYLEGNIADELVKQGLFDKMVYNKFYGKIGKNKKFIGWGFRKWRPDHCTVDLLFENNYGSMVGNNLFVFKNLKIDKKFALKLIEFGGGDSIFITENVGKFKKLNKEDRMVVLKKSLCELGLIKGENISFGYGFYQMMNGFSNEEILDLLNCMMIAGNEKLVARVLMFLKFDLTKEFLFKILQSKENLGKYVLNSFNKFKGLSDDDIKKVKMILVENGEGDVVKEYNKKLK